jgi:hypothetical protein
VAGSGLEAWIAGRPWKTMPSGWTVSGELQGRQFRIDVIPAGLQISASAPISVHAAIRLLGSGEATVGELERRLRCSGCGNRQVGVMVRPDTRAAEAIERNGSAPETQAGLPG